MEKGHENEEIIDINDGDQAPEEVFEDVIIEEDDSESVPATVKKLREKLKKCEIEKHEYLDGWQRSKAEFVNTRKRDNEQKITAVKMAKEDVVFSVLPVLDSFDMAFAHADTDTGMDENWISGMQNVRTQLLSVLKDHGVEEIDPLNEIFNPNTHESVEMVQTANADDEGKIVKVLQKGYLIDGKMLRAPKVCVAHIAADTDA